MAETKKKLVAAGEADKAVKKVAAAGEKVKKTVKAAEVAVEKEAEAVTEKADEAVKKKPAAKKAVEKKAEEIKEAAEEAAEETVSEDVPAQKKKEAKPTGSATGYRIGAIALWVVALGLEIVAILILLGNISINLFNMTSLTQVIIFLVLDLICVIIGSQLWKKANHIKPASKKNKLGFWIWNNMGVIVSVVCFLPFIIIALTNKDTDKKTKTIATVVAVIALLIAGVASYDFNPVSAEEKDSAIEYVKGDVYWAPFGKVYHTHQDCQSLNHTDTLTYGDVEQAIAANRTRLCSFCARRDDIDASVVTDGKTVEEADIIEEVIENIDDINVEAADD